MLRGVEKYAICDMLPENGRCQIDDSLMRAECDHDMDFRFP